jgi:ABC-type dipeptide/oligopeptide/nickel transport system permease component
LKQASLLSGAFIAEYFFNLQGLGKLTLEAVNNQDLYLVMASLMMGATMLIVGICGRVCCWKLSILGLSWKI